MSMTSADYMAKAVRALAEAHVLLQVNGREGACNRAYYAMFDAAHAALLGVGVVEQSPATHSGVIAAFGLKLVNQGLVRPEYGRSLRQVESLRGIADYGAGNIPMDKARWAVAQAEDFVAVVRELLTPGLEQRPDDPDASPAPDLDL
ncbi:HEPN domain-containing protein [Burkholderia contaminans]|uniref:HEPN domain-containing protein n=1 Tax=Burkholderia contaminans TaxID=488447 RepID=UPI001C89648F|nr:HEPN domain-containing protein [Burkholderia contaminans]